VRSKTLGFGAAFALVLALASLPGGAEGEQKQPVYVGARVCAQCHAGTAMGHQFGTWLLSKHARAYASLALPSAKAMAVVSGIRDEPQESGVCLGCHATAADVEGWERDPTFRVEDGVQCERCHGPGSEYMDEEVMRDPEAARRAGLRILAPRECDLCHYPKGSHVAVHGKPRLEMVEARTRIAHPTPPDAEIGAPPEPLRADLVGSAEDGASRYVGVPVCAECHRGPAMGYSFSVWRAGPHARAYASLSTPTAFERAREAGIKGEPQQSPSCLECHATGAIDGVGHLETSSLTDGVGCESCHGPGSRYVDDAVMRDPRAARAAGLKRSGEEACVACHESAHGKPFDFAAAMSAIAHPNEPPVIEVLPEYKTPIGVTMSPDGREVWVACEASNSVIVVDAVEYRMLAEIDVGRQPTDLGFTPDGRLAFVTNRMDDSISVIDAAGRRVLRTLDVHDEPHGVLTDAAGRYLYVLNTSANDISVIDLETFDEVKRLSASRNPWSMALSPDGSKIFVTNNLSRFVEFRTPSMSEITVIDTERAVVEDRLTVPETNLLQGVGWHPEGEFALFTLNRTKNLVPMTRILQGWTITNGIGLAWRDGRVDQVLLDEPNMHFPDATDVAVTPDGRYALVTSSGSDRVAVVDVPKLLSMLDAATPEERATVVPNHLGKAAEFVVKQIPTRDSPRGVVIRDEGDVAFVANALDDSLTVIDLATLEAVRRIDLGGPEEITQVRRGERLFHSADIAFQRQFSCHSCHPDGHVDGLTYDIEPDGIGRNPVDNRTLRGILDTAPFKWEGTNPTLSRQCGPRLAVFFTRIDPFDPEELAAVESYIRTIPRPPNRYRALGAELTEAQRRGKKMFDRTRTNDGRLIPEDNRCVTCHFPPLYTDRTQRDIDMKMDLDDNGIFDVPHLSNIYDSAPYMHNGISPTLEEIWTRYNPNDTHGVTNDMTKDQLNDLIEYLKTL